MTLEETANRAVAEDQPLLGKLAPQFFEGDVFRLVEHGKNRSAMRLDPARTAVAAKCPGPGIALFALTLAPAADARSAYTKTLARLAMRQSSGDCRKNTNPKINRQSFRHVCRLPSGRQYESDQR